MNERKLFDIIADRMTLIRKEKGLSQQQLADKMGLTRPSIVNIEKGRHKPSLPYIYQFAFNFEIDLDKILPNPSDLFQEEIPSKIIDKVSKLEDEKIEKNLLKHLKQM